MKEFTKYLLTGLLFAVLFAPCAFGQDGPTVEEIVKKANHVSYYQGDDGRAMVTMTIKDSQGRERTRQFTILRKDVGSEANNAEDLDQKFYVYFHRPADVNQMVFLVWKHLKKDDDRWLYLPGLDLVKRIAASDKRTSFVGSNFFYEDVSGRSIEDDVHTLENTTKSYYVVKNVPRDKDLVEFSHYTMYIHKTSFLPVKVEFFDKKGEKYREYSALKVETIQGFPTVTKASMKDLRTKGETVTEYTDVKYNIGLPDAIFTERYLRRAPAKYLK